MTVLAIDPGCEQSAYVVWDGERVIDHGKRHNADLLVTAFAYRPDAIGAVVFEQVASYGMPVGAEVFETVFWTGRFYERACGTNALGYGGVHRLLRKAVKLHLCGQMRAKDANIRQALIDRFGGKAAAIGTKKAPGRLYGLKADEWQALALAITFREQHGMRVAQL